MRIFFTFLVFIAAWLPLSAQQDENAIALDLVRRNSAALGLSADDITNSAISNTYTVTETGIRMVYLQQTWRGIPVFNQLHVLAFRDGLPVSVAGGRAADMDKNSHPQNAVASITAATAVRTAMEHVNVVYTQPINPLQISADGRTVSFGNLGIAHNGITATQVWMPDDAGQARLAWQVELAPKSTSDHWLIRVDATANTVLDKNNYTVYCNWQHSESNVCYEQAAHQHRPMPAAAQSPDIINGATYKVVPFPAESPQHPGGALANRTDPWLLAPAGSNATTLKWHSTGTTDYTITRGNNVWAYEDRNADNVAGAADTSTTADPLTFTKTYDFALEPIVTVNQRAATTNLFYWCNIIHDVMYLYGLNEVTGNFQTNNQGRGGTGNDHVLAEAQDGSGVNNANFNTPADGTSGRMQMYLWNAPTPDRDGDLDNGIIIHEYGHGVSNRLTGGPANSSCLGNQEQMGEGWSDYLGLMLTHDWATAVVTDGFNNPRGIGTYALNQPITGVGIRTHPYTTNMTTNPLTYSNITTAAVPHGIGTVWCTILWDMTWNLIEMDGITPSLYTVNGTGGNVAALKLVMEGMRLQPCNPGFVDGRNAILRADTLLFGGRYSCAIWKAFARRGVGVSASQGLSSSRSDQTVAFDEPNYGLTFAQNVTQQAEGQQITYTVNTRSVCVPMTNFKVVDTLPANVTHISGGTYNSGNRTVTFSPITLATGASQNNTFTVQVNAGSYSPPASHINEAVTGATIPASWTATSTTTTVWAVSNASSASAPNSFFSPNATGTSEQILTTTGQYAVNGLVSLTFRHRYVTEANWDGGVVEISTNNGAAWTDLGPFMTTNGYNATLGSGSALAGRRAFSGNSGAAFIQTVVDLTSFRGQSIRIRFRFASDGTQGSTGWYVDDILLNSEAAVITKANLFNASNVLQLSRELSAKITQGTVPVQLLLFGGLLKEGNAQLSWETENEVNTRLFEVERSFDGQVFTAVRQVAATGGNLRTRYAYTDAGVTAAGGFTGVVYYRLRMADRNGEYAYSRIVRLSDKAGRLLTIAPNPVQERLLLNGFRDGRRYEAVVTDITGKVVLRTAVSFAQNGIDVSRLQKGLYLLQVVTAEGREVYRFVKD